MTTTRRTPVLAAVPVLTAGLVLGALLLGAGPASAHVSADKSEVPAGGFTAVTLTVPHGCEASPTRQLVIQVPEGIDDVTPEVVPGWDIAIDTEPLAEPVEDSDGEQTTERESAITFTARAGSELPDGFRQDFTLGFQAPDTPGEYLFFKTIQVCDEGQTEWIEEYTGEGEEPEHPAPAVEVVAAEGDEHGGGDTEDAEHADEADDADESTSVESETVADTTDDSDDGSTQGIAIAALALGVVGLATGGTALAKARKAPKAG